MDAHRLGGQLERGLAREQFRHAGLDVAAQAGHPAFGSVARQQPGRFEPRGHVGKFQLDGLVFCDRLAEGRALLCIRERCVESRARDTDSAGRDVDPADFEYAEDLGKTTPWFADEVCGRDAVVDVGHLDGLDALVAELADVLADGDAFVRRPGFLLHDERADTLVGACG